MYAVTVGTLGILPSCSRCHGRVLSSTTVLVEVVEDHQLLPAPWSHITLPQVR